MSVLQLGRSILYYISQLLGDEELIDCVSVVSVIEVRGLSGQNSLLSVYDLHTAGMTCAEFYSNCLRCRPFWGRSDSFPKDQYIDISAPPSDGTQYISLPDDSTKILMSALGEKVPTTGVAGSMLISMWAHDRMSAHLMSLPPVRTGGRLKLVINCIQNGYDLWECNANWCNEHLQHLQTFSTREAEGPFSSCTITLLRK